MSLATPLSRSLIASSSKHVSRATFTRFNSTLTSDAVAESPSTPGEDNPRANFQSTNQEKGWSYGKWLNAIGARYKEPLQGKANWLGGDVVSPTSIY